MKTLFKSACLFAVLSIVLCGCSERRGEVTIRVVATSDVHGQIFDKDILSGNVREGSLAKVATLLKAERKNNRNVIYLDAGDILQGSVEDYQDITAQFFRESLPAKAYTLLGCDVMTVGNHDLSVGALSYERFFSGLKCSVVGANVCFDNPGDYLPPYRIIERQGVRIAVIGLVTPVVNYSVPADVMGELRARDPFVVARSYMPVLKEKADVIIGLVHSGYEDGRMDAEGVSENFVKQMLDEVSGFDVIIYGHDHLPACFKAADCSGDSVLLLNPGPFAMKTAAATVKVDFGQGDEVAVSADGELIDNTVLTPDAGFEKALSGWYDDVICYADSVVGSISAPLECVNVLWGESSAVDYIHSLQLDFFAADISLTAPVVTETYIPAGDFRIRDAFSLYRFDNTMVSVNMKGKEIKNVLEYSAGLFYNSISDGKGSLLKLKTDGNNGYNVPESPISNFISAAGINYEIDVTKPVGERVSITTLSDGRPFDMEGNYRTTINSFLYSGKESAVIRASGIRQKEMPGRFNASSAADIRYYVLTEFALTREDGNDVEVKKVSNWKLVPENLVQNHLRTDTVHFSLNTRNH